MKSHEKCDGIGVLEVLEQNDGKQTHIAFLAVLVWRRSRALLSNRNGGEFASYHC